MQKSTKMETNQIKRIKKHDKPQLLNLKEGGYVCGDKPRARNDVMRRQIRCMDDHDIVSSSQIKSDHNVGGKNTLPICWKCYDGTKLLQCLHLVDAKKIEKGVPINDQKMIKYIPEVLKEDIRILVLSGPA